MATTYIKIGNENFVVKQTVADEFSRLQAIVDEDANDCLSMMRSEETKYALLQIQYQELETAHQTLLDELDALTPN